MPPNLRNPDDQFPDGLPEGTVERAVAVVIMQACKPVSWAPVLDWAGLLGTPIAATAAVAERHGRSYRNLLGGLYVVRNASATAVLPLPVWSQASRHSGSSEDHPARVRWAWLLHCPPPDPPATTMGPPVQMTLSEQRMIRQAAEILAATGPLSVAVLTGTVQNAQNRAHRHVEASRLVELLTHTDLAELEGNGQVIGTGQIGPKSAHLALLAAARTSGRIRHTTAEVQELVMSAGGVRPVGPTLYNHPLLQVLGRDRWEILGIKH